MRVFDVFPFFNELDVLEIRLNELAPMVHKFVILEAGETYGGDRKPYYLTDAMDAGRFAEFADKISIHRVPMLFPPCKDRTSGREREAYQRDVLLPCLKKFEPEASDAIIFSDCDEIPRRRAVMEAITKCDGVAIHRLKQYSYYYTVNTMVDYGHDFASRARVGRYYQVLAACGLYNFRMANKNTDKFVVENGGWHFSYFGGSIDTIKTKVAALSPFLNEYKLFGDQALVRDILDGKDLHHRRCEMPETFHRVPSDDKILPEHYLANMERFKHFTLEHYKEHYAGMLPVGR